MGQMTAVWQQNVSELSELLTRLKPLEPGLERFADSLMKCWKGGGKVLFAGNGGSAADAMHFAEELIIRFHKNRAALAAIALCDPTVITCTGNDFGYDEIFARQVEGLGKSGDVLVLMSTSGNSANLVRALEMAKKRSMITVAMVGKDGGKLKGLCDIELIVPSQITHHIQEIHKVIYHAICQWVDTQVD